MEYITKGLEPAAALQYFEELCAIPHNSGSEAAVAEYLKKFAEDHGLYCKVDEVYNVLIKKPATPGYEDKPAVLLQGHTDMVCVKLPGVEHDFEKDPLPLQLKDGILTSKGTTLGADDATAVAHVLALLADEEAVHPALECVFTSMEEIGLLGAMKFDASELTAKYMINMDSGANREDVTTVSNAGGLLMHMRKPAEYVALEGDVISLSMEGMLGGHSAMVIAKERGNAIKLMARMIKSISNEMKVNIVSFVGGAKMNAIAAESDAVLAVADGAKALEIAEKVAADIKGELASSDPGFKFTSAAGGEAPHMMSDACTKALLQNLFLMPNGVRSMSMDIKDLVVASSNIGVMTLEDGVIHYQCFIRSSEDTLRDLISEEVYMLADLFGFSVEEGSKFSGWKFDPHSQLRAIVVDLYKEMYGKDMEFTATHGAMEMGEFKSKMPWLDIAAFAPDCGNPHTPDEYLNVESFGRIYVFLKALLKKLAEM